MGRSLDRNDHYYYKVLIAMGFRRGVEPKPYSYTKQNNGNIMRFGKGDIVIRLQSHSKIRDLARCRM